MLPLFTARSLAFGLDVLHACIPARWQMAVFDPLLPVA
jgi:hypothetical protein